MKVLIILAVGFAIRTLLNLYGASSWLEDRFELSSPLTSWKRAQEAVFLSRNNLPLYEGDVAHFPPLLVKLFSILIGFFGKHIEFAFMFADVITALVLQMAASNFSKVQARAHSAALSRHGESMSPVDYAELQLNPAAQALKPFHVLLWTAFNPFLILACVAKSTSTFENLFLASFLMFYSSANRLFASFFLALCAYTSVYPIGLLPALCLQMWKADKLDIVLATNAKSFTRGDIIKSCFKTVACFMVCLAGLLQASNSLDPTSHYISSVYGFILGAPDASPNLGLFWYLFAEMFDHFHQFFLVVFQLNPFIYVLPLTIRLSDDPIFLVHQLIGIFAIFKSYPTLADIGFFISLIPLWSHLTKYMRNVFIVTCMFAAVCILAPVLFQLWIFAGAANANFYFGATLAFSTAEIFLVTDLLYARLRSEFHNEVGQAKPQIPHTDRQALLMLS